VVVGKHGHHIVERNLLRRRLRELVRMKMIPVIGGMDIVLRSLPSGYDATFVQLSAEVDRIVTKLSGESGSEPERA
jgi:ribonuclease P protein component